MNDLHVGRLDGKCIFQQGHRDEACAVDIVVYEAVPGDEALGQQAAE